MLLAPSSRSRPALVLLGAAPASASASVEVSAGAGYSCAIRVDRTITCWGLDDHGEGAPPTGTFTAIDAGAHHACAIRTDGTVECWGNNADGEATPPPGTFTEVSAGGDHSCGLRTDSTLACWGRNTQSPPFNVAPVGSYRAVSAGNTAGTTWSCAVATAGTITCWGYNSYGRGNPPPGAFLDAGAGGTHGCALASDAGLACWGGYTANGAPFVTPPPGQFGAVSAGYDHSCAIREDGTLACFGDDLYGQATPPAGTFEKLSAGYHHNCAVRSNGAVACWGTNVNGQVSPIPAELTRPFGGVAPKGLEFKDQPQSTVSPPQEVTVTNSGACRPRDHRRELQRGESGRFLRRGLDLPRSVARRRVLQHLGSICSPERGVAEGQARADHERHPGRLLRQPGRIWRSTSTGPARGSGCARCAGGRWGERGCRIVGSAGTRWARWTGRARGTPG